ncbi:MAG TPA: hypothetical protein VIU34_16810, partial [Steroidobacter sp.]
MKLQRTLLGAVVSLALLTAGAAQASQSSGALASEIPENFEADNGLFDYTREEVMIPMRDGVKLFTVIWKPKHLAAPAPIVITRTP